jgi:iron complex transport system substrate-binding protein
MGEYLITRREFAALVATGVFAAITEGVGSAHADEVDKRRLLDSLGREVCVPVDVVSVMPVSVSAQTLITILKPECLVSTVTNLESDSDTYSLANLKYVLNLPNTGKPKQFEYTQVLLDEASVLLPDVVLDVGAFDDESLEQIDYIQNSSGIPYVYTDISFGKIEEAICIIGDLLGCPLRASAIVEEHCRIVSLVESVPRDFGMFKIFYAPRHNGIQVNKTNQVQIEILSNLGFESFVQPYDFNNKTIDLYEFDRNPVDLIIFDDFEVLEQFSNHEGAAYEIWGCVDAVERGDYIVSPALMHSWWGSLVLVRFVGILWLLAVVFPDGCSFDLVEEVQKIYFVLYGINLSKSDAEVLIGVYRRGGYFAG